MVRVTIYLKSGAAVEFEAEAILETGAAHPKFRLDFPAPSQGGRRLAYLDRDDVSAVVVVDGDTPGLPAMEEHANASAPVAVPETIRQEVQEVLAVSAAGAADRPALGFPGEARRPPLDTPQGRPRSGVPAAAQFRSWRRRRARVCRRSRSSARSSASTQASRSSRSSPSAMSTP
jgi:hypothetical protein